jgi:hypothetical protein
MTMVCQCLEGWKRTGLGGACICEKGVVSRVGPPGKNFVYDLFLKPNLESIFGPKKQLWHCFEIDVADDIVFLNRKTPSTAL